MRQSLVNRSVIALASLLALACGGFAWVVEHPPRATPEPPRTSASAVPAGAELFEARCARCHDIEEATGPLAAGTAAQQARAELLAFLGQHRKSDPAENAAIVEYLEAAVAGQPGPAAPADPAH